MIRTKLQLTGCAILAFTIACGSGREGEPTTSEAPARPAATKPTIVQDNPHKDIAMPFYGVELDAHRIHECQVEKKNCPADLPAEQFACQSTGSQRRDTPCTNSVPDGRCCSFYERVSYNRKFAAALEEHRKQQCAGVKCYEGTGGMGRYRPGCNKGRCTFWSRDDDLESFDL